MKLLLRTGLLLTLATTMTLAAADFMPIAPGNQWTYQDAVTGQSFTVQVGVTPFFLNQHIYHPLKGYTPTRLLVRLNEYGNVVYWDEERETDVMLTSFEIVPGAWFEAAGRECPEMGQPQENRVPHNGPAGSWNALEIKYVVFACADIGDISEQFAENIGMVQRVVNTIAGPRTFNLVHAMLANPSRGTLSISAGHSGGFTVTALPRPAANNWIVTLRIDQTLSPLSKLHFASAQEYDLRLRDAEGNVVWTWSAGQMFAQTEHDLHLSGRWNASVAVPFPAVAPEGSRLFTLEAWTTNDGGSAYAATATVEVPLAPPTIALGRNLPDFLVGAAQQ